MSAAAESGAPAGLRRLPAGRKAELADFVAQVGQVTVGRLAEHFDVSADTIRRDLDQLHADGVLVRTHGGAVSLASAPRPGAGVEVRAHVQAQAKDAMGALAASLVPDGASVLVNAGTTTLAVVRHFTDHRDLTIATNSLAIPAALPSNSFRDLYVLGGIVRQSDQATVGPVSFPMPTAAGAVDVRCDIGLIAVGAVSHDRGYTTSNTVEAAMMGEMMSQADTVVVLADSLKFERRLFAKVAELGRASQLVTNAEPPRALRAALEAAGVEILIAEV